MRVLCQMLERKETGDGKMSLDLVIRMSLMTFNILVRVALTEVMF